MTYGSEAWHLDEQLNAKINGANARLLSRFTGKSAHEEACANTTYDLIAAIKRRRFTWLGHILRMQGKRLVKLAIEVQHGQQLKGDMFQGLPADLTFGEIHELAQDRKLWKEMRTLLGDLPVMKSLIISSKSPSPPLPKKRKKKKKVKKFKFKFKK